MLTTAMEPNGRSRVLIEAPSPAVDDGRYPAKRIVEELLVASCDLIADGHDAVAGALLYRAPGATAFTRVPLVAKGNDRFAASFVPNVVGRWEIAFEGWI